MAKRKRSTAKPAIVRDPTLPKASKEVVGEALQTTFWLQGNLKSTPAEVIQHLDAAIQLLVNEKTAQVAYLSPIRLDVAPSSQRYIA